MTCTCTLLYSAVKSQLVLKAKSLCSTGMAFLVRNPKNHLCLVPRKWDREIKRNCTTQTKSVFYQADSSFLPSWSFGLEQGPIPGVGRWMKYRILKIWLIFLFITKACSKKLFRKKSVLARVSHFSLCGAGQAGNVEPGEPHEAEQGQVQGPAPWLRQSPVSVGTGGQIDWEMEEILSWYFCICSMVSGGCIL